MRSEKCVARRGRAWDGMRVIAVCFTRALQRCAGRTNMRFLLILQEVRAIGKTRNQFRRIEVHDRVRSVTNIGAPSEDNYCATRNRAMSLTTATGEHTLLLRDGSAQATHGTVAPS